jgi:hypothetical protein
LSRVKPEIQQFSYAIYVFYKVPRPRTNTVSGNLGYKRAKMGHRQRGYTKPLDSHLKLKDILEQGPDRHSGSDLGYDSLQKTARRLLG